MNLERESETSASWRRVAPILVGGMDRNFTLRVHLLSVIAALEGVVDGTFHSLLQLDIGLGSGQDFTHSSNALLQQCLYGGRNLQPVNEYECRDILTVVGNFGQPALEVAVIGLEYVACLILIM